MEAEPVQQASPIDLMKEQVLETIVSIVQEDLKDIWKFYSNTSNERNNLLRYDRRYSFIDKGTFGKVIECNFTKSGKRPFCIKVMEKRSNGNCLELETLMSLQKIKNTQIVRCYYQGEISFPNQTLNWGILKYCNRGSLKKILETKECLPPYEALGYFSDIVRGCLVLQKANNSYHRDLKCANILIHNNRAFLGDLGSISKPNETIFNERVGTPSTEAPEIKKTGIYDETSDVWSLGIILYQMLYGYYSIDTEKACDMLENKIHGKIIFESRSNSTIEEKLQKFIKRLLVKDPVDRIRWEDIFKDQIFKESSFRQLSFSLEFDSTISLLNSSFIFSMLDNSSSSDSSELNFESVRLLAQSDQEPLDHNIENAICFYFNTLCSLKHVSDSLINEISDFFDIQSHQLINEEGLLLFLDYSELLLKKQCYILAAVKESLKRKSKDLFSKYYQQEPSEVDLAADIFTRDCLEKVIRQ